jgi:hypothetical protein
VGALLSEVTAAVERLRTPVDLPRLRILTLRALAVSKAYEFVDNPEGTAALYADLFRAIGDLMCAIWQEFMTRYGT